MVVSGESESNREETGSVKSGVEHYSTPVVSGPLNDIRNDKNTRPVFVGHLVGVFSALADEPVAKLADHAFFYGNRGRLTTGWFKNTRSVQK